MAVDTAQKRFSSISVSQPWRGVMSLPSGSITQDIRQVISYLYSGILAQVITADAGKFLLLLGVGR